MPAFGTSPAAIWSTAFQGVEQGIDRHREREQFKQAQAIRDQQIQALETQNDLSAINLDVARGTQDAQITSVNDQAALAALERDRTEQLHDASITRDRTVTTAETQAADRLVDNSAELDAAARIRAGADRVAAAAESHLAELQAGAVPEAFLAEYGEHYTAATNTVVNMAENNPGKFAEIMKDPNLGYRIQDYARYEVKKDADGTPTVYVYDSDGNVAKEHDGDPAIYTLQETKLDEKIQQDIASFVGRIKAANAMGVDTSGRPLREDPVVLDREQETDQTIDDHVASILENAPKTRDAQTQARQRADLTRNAYYELRQDPMYEGMTPGALLTEADTRAGLRLLAPAISAFNEKSPFMVTDDAIRFVMKQEGITDPARAFARVKARARAQRDKMNVAP